MSWRTAGLAGQVIDGVFCYVEAWDLAFQLEAARIAGLGSVADRREALDKIEGVDGLSARKRMEAAVKRRWKKRTGR